MSDSQIVELDRDSVVPSSFFRDLWTRCESYDSAPCGREKG